MADGPTGEANGFGYAEILDRVWPHTMAVDDAQGNLTAAEEALRLPMQRAQSAREALVQKRNDLTGEIAQLGLVGKTISIESGTSLAVVRGSGLEKLSIVPERHDLEGVEGMLIGAAAGTVWGREVADAGTIVFHVDVRTGVAPTEISYIFSANEAVYTIAGAMRDPEVPQAPPSDRPA